MYKCDLIKQWIYRQRVLKLYQRLLRGISRCPSDQEREYYASGFLKHFETTKKIRINFTKPKKRRNGHQMNSKH